MLMQTFGVTNKEYYGMSSYFLEWLITNCERQSGIVGNNVKHVAREVCNNMWKGEDDL